MGFSFIFPDRNKEAAYSVQDPDEDRHECEECKAGLCLCNVIDGGLCDECSDATRAALEKIIYADGSDWRNCKITGLHLGLAYIGVLPGTEKHSHSDGCGVKIGNKKCCECGMHAKKSWQGSRSRNEKPVVKSSNWDTNPVTGRPWKPLRMEGAPPPDQKPEEGLVFPPSDGGMQSTSYLVKEMTTQWDAAPWEERKLLGHRSTMSPAHQLRHFQLMVHYLHDVAIKPRELNYGPKIK